MKALQFPFCTHVLVHCTVSIASSYVRFFKFPLIVPY